MSTRAVRPGDRREPFARQHPQGSLLEDGEAVDTVTAAGTASGHPALPVSGVAMLQEFVEVSKCVERWDRGQMVAAEPANVALDDALLVSPPIPGSQKNDSNP